MHLSVHSNSNASYQLTHPFWGSTAMPWGCCKFTYNSICIYQFTQTVMHLISSLTLSEAAQQCRGAALSFLITVNTSFQFTHPFWGSTAMLWGCSKFPYNSIYAFLVRSPFLRQHSNAVGLLQVSSYQYAGPIRGPRATQHNPVVHAISPIDIVGGPIYSYTIDFWWRAIV